MLIARIYYTVSTGAAYTRSTLRKSVLAAGAAQDKGTFGSESNLSVLGKYNTYNHLGLLFDLLTHVMEPAPEFVIRITFYAYSPN